MSVEQGNQHGILFGSLSQLPQKRYKLQKSKLRSEKRVKDCVNKHFKFSPWTAHRHPEKTLVGWSPAKIWHCFGCGETKLAPV